MRLDFLHRSKASIRNYQIHLVLSNECGSTQNLIDNLPSSMLEQERDNKYCKINKTTFLSANRFKKPKKKFTFIK
jgi:hypothetical protein